MPDIEEIIKINDKKEIVIKFDELFDQDVSHINNFSLAKKRNYVSIRKQILKSLRIAFEETDNFPFNYAAMKYEIVSRDEYKPKDFVRDVREKILVDELTDAISDIVEDRYDVNLDGDTKKSKNVNEGLLITDGNAKAFSKASVVMRVVAPIVTDYLEFYDDNHPDDVLLEVYNDTIQCFGDEMKPLNKLYNFVNSRVMSTKYSDRVMWSYLKNLSINPNILTRDIYKKIIVNVLPKLKPNSNLVSYLQAVTRNNIRYQFKMNFSISYTPLNLNRTDSDGLSEMDKLEINMLRLDEGNSIVKALTIKQELERLQREFGFEITEEELEYYKENCEINKMQTNIMFLFYARYMGAYNNSFNASLDQYMKMAILLRKWFKTNGFPVLHRYILGVPESFKPRERIGKQKFLDKLMDSKRYKELHDTKFRYIVQNVVNSGMIIRMISTLKANEFYHIPPPDSGREYMEEIDYDIERISEEVLRFIEII